MLGRTRLPELSLGTFPFEAATTSSAKQVNKLGCRAASDETVLLNTTARNIKSEILLAQVGHL